ncbi:GNAT family N-acetyltransferase [Natronoglomus mannanivorans]|uniref:GNAT family N-acetyltransferase n=1 Tax=Natronoglomus mannanivorans TaxID=2979990 RepID=A0AAP2YXR6_9EURY|nr:GNAT family N-acetyltransferase [Halobacteria archaeon AArc-xg1-1]
METRKLEADERPDAVALLRQLWTDREPDEVLEWAATEGYHLFGRFDGDELVGFAGVLECELLHHTTHAWLYDLVVDEPRRGEGHGTALLEFVERWASDRGCEYVALASPLAKEEVHEFYETRSYEKWGYVLETEL